MARRPFSRERPTRFLSIEIGRLVVRTALLHTAYWFTRPDSSDLDVGRRPELKSEDFSFGTLWFASYDHFCA